MIHQFDKKRRVLFFPISWANSVASWCAGVSSPKGTLCIENTMTPKEGGASLKIDINEERIISLALKAVEKRTQFSDVERKLIKGMFQGATDQKILTYRNDLFGIDMDALRKNLGLDEKGEGALQENQTDASTSGEAYDISTEEKLAEKAPKVDLALDASGEETTDSKIKRIGISGRAAREDHEHPVCYEIGDIPLFRGGDDYTSYMPNDTLPPTITVFTDEWKLGNTEKKGFKIIVLSRIEEDKSEGVHYLFFREATVSKNGNFTAVGGELGATAIMA